MIQRGLRILLAEDDPDRAEAFRSALAKSGSEDAELYCVDCLAAALERLAADQFDIIVFGLSLRQCRGLETVIGIRQRHSEIPVIVVTSTSQQVQAVEAAGEQSPQYLRSDELTPGNLRRVLRYAVERQQTTAQLHGIRELLSQKDRQLADLHERAQALIDQVSHEFRTPLTVIMEFAAILGDGLAGGISKQQREFLDVVNDRAADLALLVDDMLDISKLESGLLGVWRRQTKIDELLQDAHANLRRKAATKRVEVDAGSEENLPVAFCDPEQIGRVITNLAVHALRLCAEGGSVGLRARSDDEASEIIVEIAQRGRDISPENLRLIRDRLGHSEGPVRCGNGFGLGLCIAKELVLLNLGQIDVEGGPGQGTTFRFSLPVWNPTELAARCLRRIEQSAGVPLEATLLVAAAESPIEPAASNVVDEFLQQFFRRNDLVVQTRPGRWLIMVNCRAGEVDKILQRLEASWAEANRQRPAGMLPDIRLQAKGTWHLTTQSEQAIRQFDSALREPEAEPALAGSDASTPAGNNAADNPGGSESKDS